MHGGDIYKNEVELDFSVNVNPLGPPGNVMEAVRRSLLQVTCYPDPACTELREKLALRYGVSSEQVIPGNGASELIFALVRAVRPGAALLIAPGFSEYERALRTQGTEILFVPPGADLEQVICDRKPDFVFLANPNNPTGQMISVRRLLSAAERCTRYGGVFAVDECFLELSDPGEGASLIPRLEKIPGPGNVVVLRAFTKTYSIPALRVGYMLLQKDAGKLADEIRAQLPDWNCSGPAQAAGTACLETDPQYLLKAREMIFTERLYLTKELEKTGIRVFPSAANYLLVYSKDAGLYEKLLAHRILIRDCSDYRGLGKGCYRIAVRRHEENAVLLDVIRRLKNEG